MAVQRIAPRERVRAPLAPEGFPGGAGGELTQHGEPREISLHGRVMTGAARVPTAGGLEQGRAHLHGLGLLRRQITRAPGGEAARWRAHVPTQLQAAQGTHGDGFLSCQLRATFGDSAGEALVVETLRVAIRTRRTDPFPTPGRHLFGRAAQARIGERDREARQIKRLAQRCFPAMVIKELLDVGEVAREHTRAGGRSRGAPRGNARLGPRSTLLCRWLVHS